MIHRCRTDIFDAQGSAHPCSLSLRHTQAHFLCNLADSKMQHIGYGILSCRRSFVLKFSSISVKEKKSRFVRLVSAYLQCMLLRTNYCQHILAKIRGLEYKRCPGLALADCLSAQKSRALRALRELRGAELSHEAHQSFRTNSTCCEQGYRNSKGWSHHNCLGHNCLGHNYLGHNCINHNYTVHKYTGHNYIAAKVGHTITAYVITI